MHHVLRALGASTCREDVTVGFRLNAVLHTPRTVADQNEDPILMILDEFQHVITIRDKDGTEPNVVGRYQQAVESRWCPHLVSGSAVTLLTKDILGHGPSSRSSKATSR